ncbi:hypothetical protein T265_08359 [Opisthorchis viverrini]|uniref:Uncharacterized protein n=1 Tax=Opisthorchis viverrini TaxID=6198 RepID=A0A074ZDY9_OPIVI|nr:hypothetical protein T265_08359 [Opisthorchis viverrini]KER23857.1 hypothetical protein T265_08359 [Opisthorchis viverrini]
MVNVTTDYRHYTLLRHSEAILLSILVNTVDDPLDAIHKMLPGSALIKLMSLSANTKPNQTNGRPSTLYCMQEPSCEEPARVSITPAEVGSWTVGGSEE